jgi:hypothetical protein
LHVNPPVPESVYTPHHGLPFAPTVNAYVSGPPFVTVTVAAAVALPLAPVAVKV